MIGLGLIISKSSDTYVYRVTRPDDIAPEIVLFALISMSNDERTLSFDVLQELALIFCTVVIKTYILLDPWIGLKFWIITTIRYELHSVSQYRV